MVSFDVVSLFTFTPLELARESIVNLLDDFDLNLSNNNYNYYTITSSTATSAING